PRRRATLTSGPAGFQRALRGNDAPGAEDERAAPDAAQRLGLRDEPLLERVEPERVRRGEAGRLERRERGAEQRHEVRGEEAVARLLHERVDPPHTDVDEPGREHRGSELEAGVAADARAREALADERADALPEWELRERRQGRRAVDLDERDDAAGP